MRATQKLRARKLGNSLRRYGGRQGEWSWDKAGRWDWDGYGDEWKDWEKEDPAKEKKKDKKARWHIPVCPHSVLEVHRAFHRVGSSEGVQKHLVSIVLCYNEYSVQLDQFRSRI